MTRVAPTFQTRDARPTGQRVSYAEFLEGDHGIVHAEWVDGEIIEMAPIGEAHDRLDVFLIRTFSEYLDEYPLGEIRHDPFNMKTGPGLPGRSPDLLFVGKKNLKRLKKTHLQGPADLAIEIISPGSRAIDRGDKYYEYEQGGVGEYWLLDPHRKRAEFYQLDKRGQYQLASPDAEGKYHSRALKGLWIRENWLWYPFPCMATVRSEWGIA